MVRILQSILFEGVTAVTIVGLVLWDSGCLGLPLESEELQHVIGIVSYRISARLTKYKLGSVIANSP